MMVCLLLLPLQEFAISMSKVRLACFLLLLLIAPTTASATQIVFDFDVRFSNTVNPGGPGPWLRATLDDAAAGAGFDVRLTMETIGLTGTEYISDWGFSVDPAKVSNPGTLTFNKVNVLALSPGDVTITTGVDHWQADGDGKYDIRFAFPTSGAGGGVRRFMGGETVIIDINWTVGDLLAADFNVLATRGGDNGPFYSAAHVQAIGTNSTWVSDDDGGDEPDPLPEGGSTVAFLGIALLAVGFLKSRFI